MSVSVKFDYDTVSEICRRFHPDIRTRIDTINIIPMMREKLSTADIQPLECTYRNDGSLHAADKLIEAVIRKPKSFVHFMYAVHKEGYEDIVDKIRDYLREKHPKLLNHLDEKLRRKGLKITSKFVMLVGPFQPESALDPTLAVQQPGGGQNTQQQQLSYHHSSQNQASLGMMQGYLGNQTQLACSDQGGVPRLPPDLQPSLVHLPGNTNEANSICSFPDKVVTDMPAPLFSKLSEKLLCRSGQPNWKKLANEIPFLSRNDVINLEKTENPGKALLDKLGEKRWTVQQLAIALESAGLQNEKTFLQENYGHQQGSLSSVTIQEPVSRQVQWNPSQSSVGRSQSKTEFTMGGNINEGPANMSSSATGQSFCEHQSMPNLAEKQNLEIANENKFNIVAMDQSSKREVGTTNLNISGDADKKTLISKSFGILNISESQKDIISLPTSSQTHDTFLQASPKPWQEPLEASPGAFSLVSPDNNDQEILIEDNQHSLKMLNTTYECQTQDKSNEDETVSVPTVVEDDPMGKSANHNADIDRLHLIQEVHQQVHQQDLPNTSLSGNFKDIHNHPGHVTMQMDSQLRNDAETS